MVHDAVHAKRLHGGDLRMAPDSAFALALPESCFWLRSLFRKALLAVAAVPRARLRLQTRPSVLAFIVAFLDLTMIFAIVLGAAGAHHLLKQGRTLLQDHAAAHALSTNRMVDPALILWLADVGEGAASQLGFEFPRLWGQAVMAAFALLRQEHPARRPARLSLPLPALAAVGCKGHILQL